MSFQNWCKEFDKFWLEHLSLKNLHFNGLLLTKVYNVWTKKVQWSYVSWHYRVMQNLKKNWLMVWKMTWGIWQNFTKVHGSLKIETFIGSFYPKQKTYELKILRGVMYYDNEKWCKIWIGIDLSVQNWHGGFDEWHWRVLENLKHLHLNGLLLSNVYKVWAKKKYREGMFDGSKYWCKIWRKTDLCFLKWHEELDRFLFKGSWKISISL